MNIDVETKLPDIHGPVRGHVPARVREKAPKRISGDRRCWCGTRLSAYNPESTCFAHSERKIRRQRFA